MRQNKSPEKREHLVDLSLLMEFLNTEDRRAKSDAWSTPRALESWLKRRGLWAGSAADEDDELGLADLERARAARRGIRALLAAAQRDDEDGAAARARGVAALDPLSAGASCRVRFGDDGVVWLETSATGLDGALGRIFGLVALAQASGSWWHRLKLCGNPTCREAFHDPSRGGNAKWCSAQCRAQINARTYRRRYKRKHGKMPLGGHG